MFDDELLNSVWNGFIVKFFLPVLRVVYAVSLVTVGVELLFQLVLLLTFP